MAEAKYEQIKISFSVYVNKCNECGAEFSVIAILKKNNEYGSDDGIEYMHQVARFCYRCGKEIKK